MKKSLLSIFLAVMLLTGILAGCKNAPAEETTEPVVIDPNDIAGIVMINAGAPVEIMYNSTGSVLLIEGYGEKGISLASTLSDYVGKPCADVVYDVATKSVEGNFLLKSTQTVVLKLAKDSVIPSETFLLDVVDKAQTAIPYMSITEIWNKDLNSSGYIGADKAKELLEFHLVSPVAPEISGRMEPANGVYFLCASIEKELSYYTLNAITGDIATCTAEEFERDYYSIYPDEEEEFIEEETYIPEDDYTEEDTDYDFYY